ncbi:hypothetical protein Tco_0693280 [Tanacetum coccineum]
MQHYLAHTDYPIWEVIQRGNGPVCVSIDKNGVIKVLPPKTAEENLAKERERKARTTLLMALPEDHLDKFYKMTDAKEMWEAIKSRFGGNDESKKMQKYILKQQFEGFSVSNSEGLHKGYDRFQSLLSQLEIHGAGASTEDANQKFLRSLPSAWSQVSLIMRTKPGVDSLSFDDLYNNLRVFESDVKGSTASSSSTQNVAFVSKNNSGTNDISTVYGVSTSTGLYRYKAVRVNTSREKNDGNTKFHQIMDFLTRSSIHFALTISPIVSTSFVEQFWTSSKSRTINNISYIDAIVAGKPIIISEPSIRSDLLFEDADGIDTLNNHAILDTIQLMGSKSTSWDQIPTNIATTVIWNVTPLFNSMLVQPTEDEGEVSERPSESQPIPSPTHPSEDQPESQPDPSPKLSSSIHIPDSNPKGFGGNHGGQPSSDRSLPGNEDGLTLQSIYDLCISLCTQVTAQAVEIKNLKSQIKQLKKKARPVINHHKAWFRAARLKKQQSKKDMEKSEKRRCVSKQGRKAVKSSKGAPSVHTHNNWDAMDIDLEATLNDAMDYTLTQDEGMTEQQNTVKPDEGTDKQNEDTDRTKISTDSFVECTTEIKDQVSGESDTLTTPTTTSTPTP